MSRGLIVVGVLLLVAALAFFYFSFVMLSEAPDPVHTSEARQIDTPLWEVPGFDLVNSEGQSVKKEDLLGKVWVAAFIFTRCQGPCPLITKRMTEIHGRIAGTEGLRLVSFSIDPSYDQPPILRAYAELWGADAGQWDFLTSSDPVAMQELTSAFKVAAFREPDSEGSEVPNITHSTNVLLIDRQGFVRALYGTVEPGVSAVVAQDMKKLLDE
jgi:cytochrome oxidase Cu insertion factor (SCO1/SenC/PrrC family)